MRGLPGPGWVVYLGEGFAGAGVGSVSSGGSWGSRKEESLLQVL